MYDRPLNTHPISLGRNEYANVYEDGSVGIMDSNGIFLRAYARGSNVPPLISGILRRYNLEHGSNQNRERPNTEVIQPEDRGVLHTYFTGSRVIASEIARERELKLQRLTQDDLNDPLADPLNRSDEALESMAVGAVDVAEEALEDIFRIPQMMADMGHLANELRAELNLAMPHILPHARELLTDLYRDHELREQFIIELTQFLSQPEFRQLYNESLREAVLGEYEEELELAARAFEAGQYRVFYFHQGRFVTKIILVITSIISFLSGLVSILRNLTSIPGQLMSSIARLENLLRRLRRMQLQIPSSTRTNVSLPNIRGNHRGLVTGASPTVRTRRTPTPPIGRHVNDVEGFNAQGVRSGRRRRSSTTASNDAILNEEAIARRIENTDPRYIENLLRTGRTLNRREFEIEMNERRTRADERLNPDRYARNWKQYDRDLFREQALEIILNNPNHPLRFLLNPETGNFIPSSSSIASGQNNVTVHMGHRQAPGNVHGNRRSRMGLQDGWANVVLGDIDIELDFIDIQGVAVHRESAILWERLGLLPRGTVARSPSTQGFIVPSGIRRRRR